MNIELLRESVKYFEQEPLRLDMNSWIKYASSFYPKNPICGTVACLAGSVMIIQARKLGLEVWHQITLPGEGYEETGARLLEISREAAKKLFYVCDWSEPYCTIYSGLAYDFAECCHPHVFAYIKRKMVEILHMRVEAFIREEIALKNESLSCNVAIPMLH